MDQAQQVSALQTFAAEELALSRYYEQLQYTLLAAILKTVALIIAFRSKLVEAGAGYVHPLLIFLSAAVGVIAIFVLALRFCALSILSFHVGATYLNVAKAVAGDLLNHPLIPPMQATR